MLFGDDRRQDRNIIQIEEESRENGYIAEVDDGGIYDTIRATPHIKAAARTYFSPAD